MAAVAAASRAPSRVPAPRCTTNTRRFRAATFRSATHADRSAVAMRAAQQEAVEAPPSSTVTPPAADPEAAKYLSILPPFFSRPTRLEEFAPGLWGLSQPFQLLGVDIRLRMTVARMPDGSLLLVSPVAPTAELKSLLAQLGGEVKHILLPSASPEHWFFGPALSDAYPDATVWAAPGLLEGKGLPIPFFQFIIRNMKPRCKVMGVDPLPAELEGQVESELLAVPFFIELAVVLPQYRALLLADTGFCMSAEDFAGLSQANIAGAQKFGVWDRLGPVTRQVFEAFPKEGKAWVDAVLSRGGWDTVIPGHASAPIRDGQRAFRECFDFL